MAGQLQLFDWHEDAVRCHQPMGSSNSLPPSQSAPPGGPTSVLAGKFDGIPSRPSLRGFLSLLFCFSSHPFSIFFREPQPHPSLFIQILTYTVTHKDIVENSSQMAFVEL